MVLAKIVYFHPYLGKIPILTNIFSNGLKPPTSYTLCKPFFTENDICQIVPIQVRDFLENEDASVLECLGEWMFCCHLKISGADQILQWHEVVYPSWKLTANAPENCCLEDHFPFWKVYFQGQTVSFFLMLIVFLSWFCGWWIFII